MANKLQGRCDANKPIIYPDRSNLYVIAPPQYWPTYWIAKNRVDGTYIVARVITNQLSIETVRAVLKQHRQISHTRPWEHDDSDLRKLLATLIYHEKVKVYVLNRRLYERTLLRTNSYLSVNCRTAHAKILSGDNSLESQRHELVLELSQILTYRRGNKLRNDDIYWSEGMFSRVKIITGSVIVTFADSVVALAKLGASVVVGLYEAEIYYTKTLYRLAKGDFEAVQNDLARLTNGVAEDIDALEAKIKAGYDIIAPVMADEQSRQVVFEFLREYVDGTTEVDSTTFKVEITLEVLLVIGTLGAGATVMAARMSHRVGQFSVRALELIVKLSKALRRLNKRKTIEAPPPVRKLSPPKGKPGKSGGSAVGKDGAGSGDVPDKTQKSVQKKVTGGLSSKAISELSEIPGGKELVADIMGTSGRTFNEANRIAIRQEAAIALQKIRSGNVDDAVVSLGKPLLDKNGKTIAKLDIETSTQIIEIKGGLKNQSSLNPKKQKQFYEELKEAKKSGKQLVYQFDGPVNPKLVKKLEKRGAIVVQEKIDLSILDN